MYKGEKESCMFDHDSPESSCLYLPEFPYFFAWYFPSLIAGSACVWWCSLMRSNCKRKRILIEILFKWQNGTVQQNFRGFYVNIYNFLEILKKNIWSEIF